MRDIQICSLLDTLFLGFSHIGREFCRLLVRHIGNLVSWSTKVQFCKVLSQSFQEHSSLPPLESGKGKGAR